MTPTPSAREIAELDAAVAAMFPREWARANNPNLANRSKARNNLRRRYREAVETVRWRAKNPTARCSDCDHCESRASILSGALTCDLDSDFEGYRVVRANDWCARFRRILTEESNA